MVHCWDPMWNLEATRDLDGILWPLFVKHPAGLSPRVLNLGKMLKERANGGIAIRWKPNKSARKPFRTRKNHHWSSGKQFLLKLNSIFQQFSALFLSPDEKTGVKTYTGPERLPRRWEKLQKVERRTEHVVGDGTSVIKLTWTSQCLILN